MTEQVDVLVAEAVLGKDAEEFLASDVGRYLTGRALQEVEECVDKLKRMDPTDVQGIRDLQNRIWRAESVQDWLAEMVTAGRQALQVLDDQRG